MIKNKVSEQKSSTFIEQFNAKTANVQAQFIRVKIRNMKFCPDWHRAAGGQAWIFMDELIVE